MYRNQLKQHIDTSKYTSNLFLKEVIRILKYLQGKWRHANLDKISETPKKSTKTTFLDNFWI